MAKDGAMPQKSTMKPNTMLLNKTVEGDTTSFTVWTDRLSKIKYFIEQIKSMENIPGNLKHEHDMGMDYWVNIKVATPSFEKVIEDIKIIFKDDKEIILCEDFKQKEWSADMLFG